MWTATRTVRVLRNVINVALATTLLSVATVPALADGRPKNSKAVKQIVDAKPSPANGLTGVLTTPQIAEGTHVLRLPDRIPAPCVQQSAARYQVPEMALLSILRQESGGRTGVINTNKDGSRDFGPAQFNERSWARYMKEHYGISAESLTNNMCQAIMAQAYALRYEWNGCIQRGNNSIWCAIGRYHSPTPQEQQIYVRDVWRQYQLIMSRGEF